MNKFLRLPALGLVGTFCALALFGCAEVPQGGGTDGPSDTEQTESTQSKPEEKPPYTPPAVEYTVDESAPASGADANGQEFTVREYPLKADSPLAGKVFYWLGSSVTYGAASEGESMADFLAAKTGAVCRKEAVSGTTLYDDGSYGDTGARSYTRRLLQGTVFDVTEHIDGFICQISTNDALSSRLSHWGKVTEDDVTFRDEFDLSTTLGAVEFIISYVYEMWGCPVYFYSGANFGDEGTRGNRDPSGTNYGALVEAVKQAVEKWKRLGYDVDVIDLFNDKAFNESVSDEYYDWCTNDPIHPKRAGYLNWWMPYFEQYLIVKLDPDYAE